MYVDDIVIACDNKKGFKSSSFKFKIKNKYLEPLWYLFGIEVAISKL